jgi:diacylglycerol kinase (CTP)
VSTPQPVEERPSEEESDGPELRRARTRSRSPMEARKVARMTPARATNGGSSPRKRKSVAPVASNGKINEVNGHLSPPTSAPAGWSWRDFSRSPSPLGLIPIHRHWRTFVHKHEVPRKALHVSVGFIVIWLYLIGAQTHTVAPYLLYALIPIAALDYLRHNVPSLNRAYVTVVGALMRESEFSRYNGVIFYLLGAWIVLYWFPKDVGMMGTMLLSWCDTAASTFGRLYGRYTPRIRRGKSLAGSLAAFLVGMGTAWWFWGWLVPTRGPFPGDETFMFTGALHLPHIVADAVGLSDTQASISGTAAIAIMSVWSGFVASASEVVDLFGLDDNLTIPVLSGLGIWGFLKIFG